MFEEPVYHAEKTYVETFYLSFCLTLWISSLWVKLFFFWEDLCLKSFGQKVIPRLEKSYNLTEIDVIYF